MLSNTKNSLKTKTVLIVFAVIFSATYFTQIMLPSPVSAAERLACNDVASASTQEEREENLIPEVVSQGFNPNDFCEDLGGYDGRSVTVCDDNTTVVPPLFRGDVNVFCEDAGGITPVTVDPPITGGDNCGPNDSFCAPIGGAGAQPESNGIDGKQCGKGDSKVVISINIGCRGDNYPAANVNPIIDMLFALFRFMAAGVGLVVIGSVIWAGIQYTAARGNPQITEAAIKRVASAVSALLLYIFSFAIANFLVPGGMLIS